MSSDSGEKVTLGITSLLSTTVFLMLVSEHLPPTADALPLIVYLPKQQQIPEQQTFDPPVWELASQVYNKQLNTNNFTIRKRVSFPENLKNYQKINNGIKKERSSLISISSNNNSFSSNNLKENEEKKEENKEENISFEKEFIKVIGRLQEIMERLTAKIALN
uniref:Neur_chan_memb domain-containing protein n=1 Tax=Meloidogyne hapla TaxID=6305 RepID=A0A1I8B8W7_MELHA